MPNNGALHRRRTCRAGRHGGNDILIGDKGDDTFWGDGGDDSLEGGEGNDFFLAATGDDIVIDQFGDDDVAPATATTSSTPVRARPDLRRPGSDFIWAADASDEFLRGHDNDFVLAAPAGTLGNEGDDWIEGGGQQPAAGDNFDLFGLPSSAADSPIIGHDVLFGRPAATMTSTPNPATTS